MIYFRPIKRELPSTKFQLENNIFFMTIFSFFSSAMLSQQWYSFFLFHFFICLSNLCLFFITPFKMFYFCLSVCFGSPHLLLCISCLFVLLFVVTQCQVVFVPKGKVFSILARLLNRVQAAKLRKNKTLKLLFNRKVLLRKLLEAFKFVFWSENENEDGCIVSSVHTSLYNYIW
jgi:hypothetical protein